MNKIAQPIESIEYCQRIYDSDSIEFYCKTIFQWLETCTNWLQFSAALAQAPRGFSVNFWKIFSRGWGVSLGLVNHWCNVKAFDD